MGERRIKTEEIIFDEWKQLIFGGDNKGVNAHNETYFHKRLYVFKASALYEAFITT